MAMDFDDILSDNNIGDGDDEGFSPEDIAGLGMDDSSDDPLVDNTPNSTFNADSSGGTIHSSSENTTPTRNLNMLLDVEVPVSIRMGTSKLFLKDVLGLSPGNIIELDEYADDLIQLTIGDKTIARGEVVIVDGYFAFRIKAIMSKTDRIQQLRGE